MHQTLITERFRPTPLQKNSLERLGLKTLGDLLRYFPNRYASGALLVTIDQALAGEEVLIYAKVLKAETKKAWRKKIPMAEAIIEDETGKLKVIWFHQAYLAKKVPPGIIAYFRGKITERKGEVYLANPEIIVGTPDWQPLKSLFSGGNKNETPVPVYPETRGLSSGWFQHHIKTLLAEGLHEQVADPISPEILTKYHLPTLSTALVWIHEPQKSGDAESARKRFAFEEVLVMQLARLRDRATYRQNESYNIKVDQTRLEQFTGDFPFTPTTAQQRAIKDILMDLASGTPMTRLLEGDVGSGKTAVAAATAYAVVKAGFEVGYMAPTEILAKQHFESFITFFKHHQVAVGLLTGSGCYKFPSKINPRSYTDISRSQLLKWVASGEIPILIGTQALIQKSVRWKNLAYVIIDEQHRFGVMQRSKLVKQNKTKAPHLLSMTATPIPRTLALTIHGDLDLSLLDEQPANRGIIVTKIIPPTERDQAYNLIRSELKAGHQAYVICPRIDEPDPDKVKALQTKATKTEAKKLAEKIFPEYTVGLVHSKLKPQDKDEVMFDFASGEIDILVATSVVEVGVNVPNATIIIIEGAERFGLAQLHQLRGRVARSEHQATCLLFTETTSELSLKRLKALTTAKNGFELAELDLALRGAGLLSGQKQWGLSDLGMDAIKNLKMVEAARATAQALIKTDPGLTKHPLLSERAQVVNQEIHFE
ncbi:MAG: ATP-dependent DNA helicase RecG [Candidatus Vogelbacteria bacterium]|nr:ATP-dependent DNA helicase RecG [Candidatus Vogelbacteria bacterium]